MHEKWCEIADEKSVCGTYAAIQLPVKRDPMPRKMHFLAAAFACLISGTLMASAAPAAAVTFVSVSPDVRIEVVDWGGSGPPLVLLAGSGDTAHIYDDFAPKLTNDFHVYGITRRGYGASSAPATGYSADRLGDDVVAVLDALHLSKPLLVGHSLAGEELSSIATRHSSRISGAVYMDAALPFAYQNPAYPEHSSDFEALQAEISKLAPMSAPTSADVASFPAFQIWLARMLGVRFPLSELKATLDTDAAGHITKQKTGNTINEATHNGEERFTNIPVPALAIFAIPHGYGAAFNALPRSTQEAFEAKEVTELGKMADQFQLGVPSAEVVRIAHANHYVFISNESEVLAAIRRFEADLRAKGLIQDR